MFGGRASFAIGKEGRGDRREEGRGDRREEGRGDKRAAFTLGGSVSGYASMEQEGAREDEVWKTATNSKTFRSAFAQELELEDLTVRGAMVSRRDSRVEEEEGCVHGATDCSVCRVADEEVEAVRRENQRLKAQMAKVQGDDERHAKLQGEIDQLTWKLRKMEESRRVYEDATSQLGSFLELVSSQLTVSGRFKHGSLSLPPEEDGSVAASPVPREPRQRRARSAAGGERRRRAGGSDTASDLGGRGAPDSVSESTDSELGRRELTRGGEKRSTLSRVRTFLRREKKYKFTEEECARQASKARCGAGGCGIVWYDVFWYGMIWSFMVSYSMVWSGTISKVRQTSR